MKLNFSNSNIVGFCHSMKNVGLERGRVNEDACNDTNHVNFKVFIRRVASYDKFKIRYFTEATCFHNILTKNNITRSKCHCPNSG